jgi:hypothetical protein
VKQIASGRLGQVAVNSGEQAPMAAVWCNACRTCVTTNIVGITTTVLAAAGVGIARFARRLGRVAQAGSRL